MKVNILSTYKQEGVTYKYGYSLFICSILINIKKIKRLYEIYTFQHQYSYF